MAKLQIDEVDAFESGEPVVVYYHNALHINSLIKYSFKAQLFKITNVCDDAKS